jgi:hypothetical protein
MINVIFGLKILPACPQLYVPIFKTSLKKHSIQGNKKTLAKKVPQNSTYAAVYCPCVWQLAIHSAGNSKNLGRFQGPRIW